MGEVGEIPLANLLSRYRSHVATPSLQTNCRFQDSQQSSLLSSGIPFHQLARTHTHTTDIKLVWENDKIYDNHKGQPSSSILRHLNNSLARTDTERERSEDKGKMVWVGHFKKKSILPNIQRSVVKEREEIPFVCANKLVDRL